MKSYENVLCKLGAAVSGSAGKVSNATVYRVEPKHKPLVQQSSALYSYEGFQILNREEVDAVIEDCETRVHLFNIRDKKCYAEKPPTV